MQFGIMFANTGHGASPDGATAVVWQRPRRAGSPRRGRSSTSSCPSGYESTYPYDPSGKMAGGIEDVRPSRSADLAGVGGGHARRRSQLGTGILIATQRNPVITAKEVATLDHLSGGRVVLGVGVGWLEEEFNALGVPFAGRGKRLDEYIARDARAVDRGQGQLPRRVRQLRRVHLAAATGQRDGADRGRRPHRGGRQAGRSARRRLLSRAAASAERARASWSTS